MREIILDTETTGLSPVDHRVVEIGCIELINHVATGKEYHAYINPERDMPAEAERGAHGHKALEQLMIPLAGSFEVTLDDGFSKETFYLKRPWEGLYIPPMTWRELKDFSSGAVCLVLASQYYDENDYFRRYEDFVKAAKLKQGV